MITLVLIVDVPAIAFLINIPHGADPLVHPVENVIVLHVNAVMKMRR